MDEGIGLTDLITISIGIIVVIGIMKRCSSKKEDFDDWKKDGR
tara:strand:- start:960 stop:1088 length:129 start_codon:yes stop_codon:yes gene_type:complete